MSLKQLFLAGGLVVSLCGANFAMAANPPVSKTPARAGIARTHATARTPQAKNLQAKSGKRMHHGTSRGMHQHAPRHHVKRTA